MERDNGVELERLTPGVRTRSQVQRDNGVEDASREAKKIRVDSDKGEDDEDEEEAYSCTDEDDSDEEDEEEEDSEDEIDGDGELGGGRKRRQRCIAHLVVQSEKITRKRAAVRVMTAAEIRNVFSYNGVNRDLLSQDLAAGNTDKVKGAEILSFILDQQIVPEGFARDALPADMEHARWPCLDGHLICPVAKFDRKDVLSAVQRDLEDDKTDEKPETKGAIRRKSIKNTYVYTVNLDGKTYVYVGESSSLNERLVKHLYGMTRSTPEKCSQSAHARLVEVLRSKKSLKSLGLTDEVDAYTLAKTLIESGALKVYSFGALGVQDYRIIARNFVADFLSKYGRAPKRSTVEHVLGSVGMVQEVLFTSWFQSRFGFGSKKKDTIGLNESAPGLYWSAIELEKMKGYSFEKDILHHEEEWVPMLKAFVAAKVKRGDARVPLWCADKPDGSHITVGVWVYLIRSNMLLLPKSKIDSLLMANFPFRENDLNWLRMLDAFKAFVEKHHHGRVPQKETGPKRLPYKLGTWVRTQRSNWEKLSQERQTALLKAGFIFDCVTNHNFYLMLDAFKAFVEKHRHGRVPQKETGPKHLPYKLGTWVRTQRINWHHLSQERQTALLKAGFIFDCVTNHNFYLMLDAFKAFVEKHRHGRVPYRDSGPKHLPYKLGTWVRTQRINWHHLSQERQTALLKAGFIFDCVKNHNFYLMLDAFKAFVEKHRHGRVPCRDSGPKHLPSKLGTWVRTQRSNWKKLSQERQTALLDANFVIRLK